MDGSHKTLKELFDSAVIHRPDGVLLASEVSAYKTAFNSHVWRRFTCGMPPLNLPEAGVALSKAVEDALIGWPAKIMNPGRHVQAGFVPGLEYGPLLSDLLLTDEHWALLGGLISDRLPGTAHLPAVSRFQAAFTDALCNRLGKSSEISNTTAYLYGPVMAIVVDGGAVILNRHDHGPVHLSTYTFE